MNFESPVQYTAVAPGNRWRRDRGRARLGVQAAAQVHPTRPCNNNGPSLAVAAGGARWARAGARGPFPSSVEAPVTFVAPPKASPPTDRAGGEQYRRIYLRLAQAMQRQQASTGMRWSSCVFACDRVCGCRSYRLRFRHTAVSTPDTTLAASRMASASPPQRPLDISDLDPAMAVTAGPSRVTARLPSDLPPSLEEQERAWDQQVCPPS